MTSGRALVDLGGFHSYKIDYIGIFGDFRNGCNSLILNGRGERIRTSDPLIPKQVRPLGLPLKTKTENLTD